MPKKKLKDRLSGRKQSTRTVWAWLGADLDLVDEYNAAVKAAEEAPAAKKLDGSGSKAERLARVEELRVRLADYRVPFVLRSIGDKKWQRLEDEHPPRKTPEGAIHPDDERGWNALTFPGALLRVATVTIDGDTPDEADWLNLLGDDETEGQLSPGEVDKLSARAFLLSKVPVDVPFWSADSLTIPASVSE